MRPCPPARLDRSASGPTAGFTLVELLIVITIVSVMVALLLPAIDEAKNASQKAVCAGKKRQLAIVTLSFAQDFKLRMPHPTIGYSASNWNTQGTYFTGATPWIGSIYTQYSGGTYLAQGTLGIQGYLTDINLLFCPGWYRTYSTVNAKAPYEWFPDQPPQVGNHWSKIIRHQAPTFFADQVLTGTAELFFVDTNWGTNTQPGQPWYQDYLSTLPNIERYWNAKAPFTNPAQGQGVTRRGAFSPGLYACMNWTNAWTGSPGPFPNGSSHIRNGVRSGTTVVFFDGSARWVPREEVAKQFSASTECMIMEYPLMGPFNTWSRRHMTLTPP